MPASCPSCCSTVVHDRDIQKPGHSYCRPASDLARYEPIAKLGHFDSSPASTRQDGLAAATA